ncbi:hypothetical protein INR76_11030 [Marixanthomonas sp. SCSIO 43207]|uniref:hypothetical protein n=1 Tax=Marixanthomonas sp. SCSIO 43207 TaxID=2779360 RepID=UPI001CA8F753|nr:hypothetical protein [Marixanthomonas sp. SCSIO 43207]UAB80644.1 hypothetical protein INR76_11030 [Marixanthomonas sp. SCSIO 43207]
MKHIVILLALFIGSTAVAQDPFLQKDSDDYELRADALTETYNAELALTSKQELLFKKKVEEFLPRYDQIRQQYEGRNKLNKLLSLGEEESAEMRNILSQVQFELYVRMKEKVQPLGNVKTDN